MSGNAQPEGIVNLLKPPGMTSSNAVADVRHLFSVKRVGHAGTLDPGAAGVLPICVGRAARLFDYLVDKEKEYYAELTLGAVTDTQDSYGKILERGPVNATLDDVRAVLPEFLGEQMQLPPMYSALKRDGQALYKLARDGEEVDRERRRVLIRELEFRERTGENRYLFRVVCSRGTYVRTLCQDIAARLGELGHLSFLLRSQAGPFRVERALSIVELEAMKKAGILQDALISMEEALSFLPSMTVAEGEPVTFLKNGRRVKTPEGDTLSGGPFRLYGGELFLGIGECRPDGVSLTLHLY